MKFVCISDTHNMHSLMSHEVPDGDFLLCAGDFSMKGYSQKVRDFDEWLGSLPHRHKIVIAGNHEVMFDLDKYPEDAKNAEQTVRMHENLITNAVYLNASGVSIEGINIWGEPRTPEFYSWAFNVKRENMKEVCWDKVPDATDILLTHGPPFGYCDLAKKQHDDPNPNVGCGFSTLVNVGCKAQAEMIKKHPNLKAVVCGHIHPSYGQEKVRDTDVTVYNASICNPNYRPVNKPLVFEL